MNVRAANVTKYCPNISLKENEHNSTFLSRGPRAQAKQGLFTPQSWPKNDKAIRVPKLLNLEVQGDCSVSCVREIGRKDFGLLDGTWSWLNGALQVSVAKKSRRY